MIVVDTSRVAKSNATKVDGRRIGAFTASPPAWSLADGVGPPGPVEGVSPIRSRIATITQLASREGATRRGRAWSGRSADPTRDALTTFHRSTAAPPRRPTRRRATWPKPSRAPIGCADRARRAARRGRGSRRGRPSEFLARSSGMMKSLSAMGDVGSAPTQAGADHPAPPMPP